MHLWVRIEIIHTCSLMVKPHNRTKSLWARIITRSSEIESCHNVGETER